MPPWHRQGGAEEDHIWCSATCPVTCLSQKQETIQFSRRAWRHLENTPGRISATNMCLKPQNQTRLTRRNVSGCVSLWESVLLGSAGCAEASRRLMDSRSCTKSICDYIHVALPTYMYNSRGGLFRLAKGQSSPITWHCSAIKPRYLCASLYVYIATSRAIITRSAFNQTVL